MRNVLGQTRYSVVLGILAAVVGFSYALATSSVGSNSGDEVAGRSVGSNPRTPLQFTNAFVSGSTDRDLGDAAMGSAIVRYVRAKGGVPPYRFTSDRTTLGDDGKPLFIGTQTLGEAIIGLPASANGSASTAAVFLNGIVQGQIGNASGKLSGDTPLRFDVTVADSRGTNPNKKDEVFRITLVDSNTFKFAQSSLSDGVAYRRYLDRLQVIAGNGPYTFTASNVTVNGVATSTGSLTDIGLFLVAKTGVVTGRPLQAGVVSFKADCVDSKGSHALARNKVGIGQVITFNVAASNRVSSDLFSTKMSIKGDTVNGGKDSITYSGLLDLAGNKVSDLDGLGVTLTIGNYTSPTVTLTNGVGTSAGPPSMTVKLNSSGMLTITIKGDSFGMAQTILKNSELANSTDIEAVSVTIGDTSSANAKPQYSSSELLRFTLKAKNSKFDLEYKFGPGNLGGGFIITSVAGKDDKAETGDSWKVSFICLPPKSQKLSTFGTIAEVNVGIGTDFFGTLPASLNKDTVKSAKQTGSGAVLTGFAFNSKTGKGGATTGLLPFISPLPNTQTQIPPALTAKVSHIKFPFLFTLTDGTAQEKEVFGAEGSHRILAKGNQWITKEK